MAASVMLKSHVFLLPNFQQRLIDFRFEAIGFAATGTGIDRCGGLVAHQPVLQIVTKAASKKLLPHFVPNRWSKLRSRKHETIKRSLVL